MSVPFVATPVARRPLLILLLTCTAFGAAPGKPMVLTHGGAGSSRKAVGDGPEAAARRALAVLKAGGSALDGAIEGTVWLEDDPRFNAGTGSNIRLDGLTVQMDAAVMDGATGGYGAVAAIEKVKNPVKVARKVMDSPHLLIVGDGATRFARAHGFPEYDPICKESRARYDRLRTLMSEAKKNGSEVDAWKRYDWKGTWNFPRPLEEALKDLLGHPDTVGTVARDAKGSYAASISTGGTTITFYGRVGDVPILGAGIYAGPKGAVACTGHGEEIIKRLLAKEVYDALARGLHPQKAVDRALKAYPKEVGIGLIALSDKGDGVGCNVASPASYRENDRMAWGRAE